MPLFFVERVTDGKVWDWAAGEWTYTTLFNSLPYLDAIAYKNQFLNQGIPAVVLDDNLQRVA